MAVLEGSKVTTQTEAVARIAHSTSIQVQERQHVQQFWAQMTASEFRPTAPDVDGAIIGTRELCEGMAHATEELLIAVAQQLSTPFEPGIIPFNPKTYFGEYSIAFEFMSRHMGWTDVGDLEPETRIEILFMFLVFCDLALSAPFRPAHKTEWRNVGWEDYHPGWRFVRAIEAVGRIDRRGPIDWKTSYQQTTEQICGWLEWISPLRVFSDPRNFSSRYQPILAQLTHRAYRLRARWPHATLVPFLRGAVGQDWIKPLWDGIPPLAVGLNDGLPYSPRQIIRPVFFGRRIETVSEAAVPHWFAVETVRWTDWLIDGKRRPETRLDRFTDLHTPERAASLITHLPEKCFDASTD